MANSSMQVIQPGSARAAPQSRAGAVEPAHHRHVADEDYLALPRTSSSLSNCLPPWC